MFGEYDFMVQKPPKSYIIRLFAKPPRSEALKRCLLHRDDGSYTPDEPRLCATLDAMFFALCCVTHNARGAIFTDLHASKLADSLCVDYPAQVTTPW